MCTLQLGSTTPALNLNIMEVGCCLELAMVKEGHVGGGTCSLLVVTDSNSNWL